METAQNIINNEMRSLRELVSDSIDTKNKILSDDAQLQNIIVMAHKITSSIMGGGKLLLCGNGGSAADAQHLAAELLIRLRPNVNREGVPALALAMDSSTFSACGNDFGFECLYERMVLTFGKPGDVLLGITTSGNSENVALALKAARKLNMVTLAFLGADGGKAKPECDCVFSVPSSVTGRIQESHIMAGHALMELVENMLLKNSYITMA